MLGQECSPRLPGRDSKTYIILLMGCKDHHIVERDIFHRSPSTPCLRDYMRYYRSTYQRMVPTSEVREQLMEITHWLGSTTLVHERRIVAIIVLNVYLGNRSQHCPTTPMVDFYLPYAQRANSSDYIGTQWRCDATRWHRIEAAPIVTLWKRSRWTAILLNLLLDIPTGLLSSKKRVQYSTYLVQNIYIQRLAL